MNSKLSLKHPFISSFLFTLLILIFPVLAGVLSQVFSFSDVSTTLLQAVLFSIAALLALFFLLKSKIPFCEIGFCLPKKHSFKKLLWFLPILFIEALTLLLGFTLTHSVAFLASTFVFCVAVGFAEELFFRGIIFQLLLRKNLKHALFFSSFLFGVGHLSNLAGGAPIVDTLLQVLFAFLFGIVAVLLLLLSKSILVPIIWHALHNFIAFTTTEPTLISNTLFLFIQLFILFIYAIYLYTTYSKEIKPLF